MNGKRLLIISIVRKAFGFVLFRKKQEKHTRNIKKTSSGGVCINDVVTHLANPDLPFGGVGHSGIGRYHGIDSFYTFSHTKSVLSTTTHINPGIKFAPYAREIINIETFYEINF